MDRLSPPKLTQLEALTPADLPRLYEQRRTINDSMEMTDSASELARLHNARVWCDECIAFIKAKQRGGKVDL